MTCLQGGDACDWKFRQGFRHNCASLTTPPARMWTLKTPCLTADRPRIRVCTSRSYFSP